MIDGAVKGTLELVHTVKGKTFSKTDLEIVENFAKQISL
ncbi:MAG: hypothetical protein ACI9T8_000527 [Candidatus Saccharimonadales bacterium]|jgi:hypothetical protein